MKLSVNGKSYTLDVEPEMPLLWALRDELDIKGPKFGCGIAQCGTCTVLLNGEPVRSCSYPVSVAAGQKVITIEGLADKGKLHAVQQAWIDHQVRRSAAIARAAKCWLPWPCSRKNPNPQTKTSMRP